MPDKKPEELFKPPTNVTADHLASRGGLGINPKDGNNPAHPRIAFQERESKARGLSTSGTSMSTPAIGYPEPGDRLAGWITPHTRNEDSGLTAAPSVPEKTHRNTVLRAPVTLANVTKGAASGFSPLRALLGTLYASYEGSTAARNKIDVLLSRVIALEQSFNSRPGSAAEQRRREELLGKLNGVEEKLRSLSENLGSQRIPDYGHGEGDTSGLLEDLQEAILSYQTARRTMIGDQGFKPIDPADAAVLNSFRYAQQAEYRHGNRNGCLKRTRGAILDEIELWIRDSGRPPVYWLNGLVGTGKTTIAQTIAERTFADGKLGASFFCSRDFEDRSNLQFIFPTLAIQLARRYTEFRSIFVPLVESDPEIAHESLCGQMNKLIVQPLATTAISTVIVIDALDECKDDEPASAILSVLGQFVAEIPKVKFFVTGRPEPRILEGFRLPLLAEATDVFVLHEVESSQVDSDVRLFFRHSFSELRGRRRGLDGWPTEEQLDLLCERSAGLFVHAVATIRFVDQRNNNPKRQLDRLMQSPESSVLEGKTKFKVNATLDSLYTSILQDAFGDDDPENDSRIRSVLGAVILATNPLSPSTIAALLDLDIEDVLPLLLSVHSLLLLQDDTDHPIRPFHKSFPDFIIDPARCVNPRFRVCPADQHTELLVGCLELMNRGLECNMCELPNGVTNSEVVDLKERAEEHIGRPLRYACRSWHKHLVVTIPVQALNVVPVLHRFLEGKFLFWLEVLSILSATREAVDALETAAKLLDVPPTLDLVRDYFRFVITFFELISTSAQHIYHSALPLSPQTSIVRELYARYSCPLARVVRGLPTSWGAVFATVHYDDVGSTAAWSPCNRFIAITRSSTIEVLDAVTLKRVNTFKCGDKQPLDRNLCFSPDSRFLMYFLKENLFSWDLQTGGLVCAIPSTLNTFIRQFFSFAYSADGTTVALTYEVPAKDAVIATYDLLSKTHTRCNVVSEGRIATPIWTHGHYLRFATVKPGSITIWEVEFTLVHAPAEVKSFPAPDEAADGRNFLFLPTLSRLAFTLRDTVLVWDANDSKFLLKSGPILSPDSPRTPHPPYLSLGSFSDDGRFFACMTTSHEVYVWKEFPSGYALHQTFPGGPTQFRSPLLSPNGESIVAFTNEAIHLLPTRDSILPPSSVPILCGDGRLFILEFSPGGVLAAFLRRWGTTVTVLDLQSGHPRLIIDAGMEIGSLGITTDTIIVVGEGNIITWKLPALNARANIDDCVRTTTIDLPPFRDRKDVRMSISPDLCRVAVAVYPNPMNPPSSILGIYDLSTGRCLVTSKTLTIQPRFALDGRDIWCERCTRFGSQTVTEDTERGVIKVEYSIVKAEYPPVGVTLPWKSPHGYQITDDGWVLSPTKKRLLWMLPHWRTLETCRTWSGRFLGLPQSGLSEVVVLEFPE